MAKTFVAEQTYYFQAPTRKVFQGLTDPKLLVKWFLADAKLSPRKGGAFAFDWIGGYHMTGRLLEYTRGKAVSYLWTDKLSSGRVAKTRVSFRVVPKGKGTLLKLRHSGFTVPAHFEGCSSRWAYFLTNMKSVLDHGTDLRSELDG